MPLQFLQDVHSLHYLGYQVKHFWNIVINNAEEINHAKDAVLHDTFLQDLLKDLVLSWYLF